MKLPDLRDFDLTGKRVLLRTDLDVPLKNGEIVDDTRIRETVPTVNHLLSKQAKIVILAHLGRPEGKVVPELSLEPVAEKLQELLSGVNVKFQISNFKFQIENNEIILLENLRFDKTKRRMI